MKPCWVKSFFFVLLLTAVGTLAFAATGKGDVSDKQPAIKKQRVLMGVFGALHKRVAEPAKEEIVTEERTPEVKTSALKKVELLVKDLFCDETPKESDELLSLGDNGKSQSVKLFPKTTGKTKTLTANDFIHFHRTQAIRDKVQQGKFKTPLALPNLEDEN